MLQYSAIHRFPPSFEGTERRQRSLIRDDVAAVHVLALSTESLTLVTSLAKSQTDRNLTIEFRVNCVAFLRKIRVQRASTFHA